MSNYDAIVNLDDFQEFCRQNISEAAWNYLMTGSGSGEQVLESRAQWDRYMFVPRVLSGVSEPIIETNLGSDVLKMPLVFAPIASHKSFHPKGELEAIRGADKAGISFCLSTHSSFSLEEVDNSTTHPFMFQFYLHRDRAFSKQLLERVESSSAGAIVVTVDTPVVGYRDLDRRIIPSSPTRLTPGQADSTYPNLTGLRAFQSDLEGFRQVLDNVLDPMITWDEIVKIKHGTTKPVFLKGILHEEDALKAKQLGLAGIIVSNHGGRNLDGVICTSQALTRIRSAVGNDFLVMVDGGITRGSHIAKAICLGADAVMIGRPFIWALSHSGSDGILRACRILEMELKKTMILLGASSLQELRNVRLIEK